MNDVGTEHSLPMRDGNLCLEEYLDGVEDPSGFLVVEDLDDLPAF